MALTMENATYARSKAGISVLYHDFNFYLHLIESALNDDKYEEFKKVIRANWTGPDANDFLADIEKSRKQIEDQIETIREFFLQAIADDAKQFSTFQAKNIK